MKNILELISELDIPNNLKVINNKESNKNNILQTGGKKKSKYFLKSKNIMPDNFLDK